MNKIIVALMVGLFAVSVNAFADVGPKGDFAKNHPRRAQVNHRLNNQNKRIHNEVKEGEMSKTQAAGLHKQNHQIRQEERSMASQNNGHITKQEQRTLNQQENGVSKEIGK
jgi:CRISPR/Cas system-associated endoribonuclease Cas2